jgi:hypothetical protein
VRERYIGKLEERKKAMLAVVGIRKGRTEFDDPQAYIRALRSGTRLDRLKQG